MTRITIASALSHEGAESQGRGELLIIAGLLLTFGVVTVGTFQGWFTSIDKAILLALRNPADSSRPVGSAWLEQAARDLSSLGSVTVLTILVSAIIAYLLALHRLRVAVWLAGSVASGALLNALLKHAFDRPRPTLATRVFTTSFPSGHSAGSALAYVLLALLISETLGPRRLKPYILGFAVLLAAAIGLTRIYLGLHYPTDVLAGWCVGGLWSMVCWLDRPQLHATSLASTNET